MSLPESVRNALDAPTRTALSSLSGPDMGLILNGPLLGMQGAQLLGMPGAAKPQVKAAILALLMDKTMLGAAIDAKVAEAVRSAPARSGINASSVDAKIKTAVDGLETKINSAVEGKLSSTNIGKMRITTSGGGRRGSKRSGSKRAKRRGTKRR